jgi:hypothetical protein
LSNDKRPAEPTVTRAEDPERGHGAVLDAARCELLLTFDELWVDYLGLGGLAGIDQVTAYLGGVGEAFNRVEHNTLVQALNEKYLDVGGDHRIPYDG